MSDKFDDYSINRNINSSTFQIMINQLPVKLLDFAIISQLRHRVYGFRLFGTTECDDDCCLNDLARQELWRILFNIQQSLISNKRISLNQMYIKETRLMDPSANTLSMGFGAIEDVNVREEYNHVHEITIDPFIERNIDLQLNGSYIEARFNRSRVKDPLRVILRDSVTYEQHPWQKVTGYPKVEGDNWVMVVGNTLSTTYIGSVTDFLHLQDYEYIVIDMPDVQDVDLDQLSAFHPNSDQVLPFAEKPKRVFADGIDQIRYTFYVWTLGKPEFSRDEVDMVEGEYYKLYDTLDIYERTEIEEPAIVYIDQTYVQSLICTTDTNLDQEVTGLAWVSIADSRHGMLKYTEIINQEDEDDLPPDYVVPTSSCDLPSGRRYKLTAYYKVNPNTVEHLITHTVEEVRRAIVAKTAATIELDSCNCVCAANDYITKMQAEFTTEFTLGGSTVARQYKYGNRKGDLLYAEILKRISFKGRTLVL